MSGSSFHVTGSNAHHVVRVLRKKVGDEVDFFDNQGRRQRGRLTIVDNEAPSFSGILLPSSVSTRSHALRLYQGLPKGPKFDYVIEKAVELGVDEIHPFLSEKSLIRVTDQEASESKLQRWNRLAEAASKQCKRPLIARVGALQKLKDLAFEPISQNLLFDASGQGATLHSLSWSEIRKTPGIINLIVGPESGFSPSEVALLRSKGAISLSLGPLIFRTETAGLVALALVSYELGLL